MALELAAVYVFLALLGLAFGSFVNSWIWRVYGGTARRTSRSQCVHCGQPIVWYDNIPLASFLALRGYSRCCHQLIPRDYFLVELAGALLVLGTARYYLERGVLHPWELAASLFFVAVLLVVFVADAKHQLIPVYAVMAASFVGFLASQYVFHRPLWGTMLAALGAWAFFALQQYVSGGRWVGGGDKWLAGLLGVWLGWPLILVGLFLAYLLGALVALPLLLLKKKQLGSPIAFGTFLSVAGLVVFFHGQNVLVWYWGLIR